MLGIRYLNTPTTYICPHCTRTGSYSLLGQGSAHQKEYNGRGYRVHDLMIYLPITIMECSNRKSIFCYDKALSNPQQKRSHCPMASSAYESLCI